MKKYNYAFEIDDKLKNKFKKCVLCGKKITDEEFEYEDYFVMFRGFTPNAFSGFICFECVEMKMISKVIKGGKSV